MGSIRVRGVAIGEGKPKVCVPLVGATEAELLDEARLIRELEPDMAELRIDYFEALADSGKVLSTLAAVRRALREMPLLFTFRSAKEGGRQPLSESAYAELNAAAIDSGLIDLVDVELYTREPFRSRVIGAARAGGVFVVVSNHDFEKTPPEAEIVDRLEAAAALGDIAKIALMPKSAEDVAALLSATAAVRSRCLGKPVVTMSMGPLGAVSRLAGEAFGSALTFGAAKTASAPGQIPVEKLKTVLSIVHDAMRSE